MPTNFKSQAVAAPWKIGAALALVYVVWGTTYFATGIAVRTMPLLWMTAVRFLFAGLLMLCIALAQGHRLPSVREWRNAGVVGVLMVLCAMNFISFAQRLGIGSGLMATVVTTMPMWLALWTRWGGERVPLTSWIGLVLGFSGAVLLAREGDFSATWAGALLAFGAPVCWSLGSYASRRLPQAAPPMATAAQWLVGGVCTAVVAAATEPFSALAQADAAGWLSLVYLLVFGTLVALNAYLWLLRNASAALAGSYAFVNPAVALLVGVGLGGERLTGWVYAALPLIAAALALILYGGLLSSLLARWWGALRPQRPAASSGNTAFDAIE